MGIMAWGMWRARYWAVLGFQLLLVFLIFSAVFGLAVQAASVAQFAATLGLLAVAGTFFYFMVKAMARIQMPIAGSRPCASARQRTAASIGSGSWLILTT